MPFHELIDFQEAKKIIMEKTKPIRRKEKVDIMDASGRVLSSDIIAKISVPGFARAAVDGYAVRAEDTYGATQQKPKKLSMDGKIFAGDAPKKKLEPGKCMQIATGAPLPMAADAVVMAEYAEKRGRNIFIYKPVYPGENVSPPDEDIKEGEKVLKKGSILDPAKIGVLAALGLKSVEVYSLPKVAIVATGKEIVPPGEKLEYGKIYDINSYTLSSLLHEYAEIYIRRVRSDEARSMENAIKSMDGMDYIVFTGGSSVGERDVLARVIEKHGEIFFHGIALKPGKPTIFGKIGKTLIFGMPGYPTSCLTNAYTLLLPSIKKMARLNHEEKTGKAILAEKIVSTIGRHQIYTVMVKKGIAYPAFKESGAITSMSQANGYIEIPANVEYLEKGTEVTVKYF